LGLYNVMYNMCIYLLKAFDIIWCTKIRYLRTVNSLIFIDLNAHNYYNEDIAFYLTADFLPKGYLIN